MKISWIRKHNEKRLILFFGGFATSQNLFECIDIINVKSDIVMFYDYRSFDCEIPKELFEYKTVDVIAWSFGVFVADFISKKLPKINNSIALCGSLNPINDDFGIPEKIFQQTVDNLDEKNFEKFFSRVYSEIKDENILKKIKCNRSISDLKNELISLGVIIKSNKTSKIDWSRVIASYSDKIFSIKNLKNFYKDNLEIIDGQHFPHSILKDFFEILCDSAVKKSFKNSFKKYEEVAVVQRKMALKILSLTGRYVLNNDIKIFEIGCGTGFLTTMTREKFPFAEIYLNDLFLSEKYRNENFLLGDIEMIRIPTGFDLIISSACFQWVRNLKVLLLKLKKSLNKNGTIAFSTFLSGNFDEIKSLTGRGLNYYSKEEYMSILKESGFEVLYHESNIEKVFFNSPKLVLKHIKDTGVNGSFSQFWTPRKMKDFCDKYIEKFSDGENVYLTYHPAFFIIREMK